MLPEGSRLLGACYRLSGGCSENLEKLLQDIGFWASRLWVLDTQCWVLGLKCWVFATRNLAFGWHAMLGDWHTKLGGLLRY